MELPSLGIDVSKRKLDVALLINGKFYDKGFDNSPQGFKNLLDWLEHRKVGKVHACLEATGTFSEDAATELAVAGHVVSIVNPARIKGFAQSGLSRTKTDKQDARVIAQFCAAWKPEAWAPPSEEVRVLREMVRCLGNLEEMYQMEENRLDAGVRSSEVVQIIEQNKAHLKAQILELSRLIEEHVGRHPGLKQQRDLLTTIRGIAQKTAHKLLAEIGDISNFASARELAAYSGLTPREHRSGTSIHGKTRISKTGNARLRAALYMPAVASKRWNPIIQTFCQRLEDRGKSKMASLGAAMRKLLHIVYGVLKHQQPFNPAHA